MRSRISLVLILLIASLLLASCAPATQEPVKEEPVQEEPAKEEPKKEKPAKEEPAAEEYPPAPEYIDFGSSIALTGNFGSLGNLVLPGYEIAIEHINADGGVFVEEYNAHIPLRLTYYDDESDPANAASKMETLYSERNLTAYLGGGGSAMHNACIPIAEKKPGALSGSFLCAPINS